MPTFTIETDCGTFESSKKIWVGVPDHDDITVIANQYPVCPNELTYFNAHYTGTEPGNKNSDIVSYTWDHPIYCYTGGQKNEILICNFPSDGYYQIRVSASNSCGLGGPIFETLYAFLCYYYSVNLSPNPANGTVNIELTETPVDEAARAVLQSGKTQSTEYHQYSFNNLEYRIKIYDMQARERYCRESGSGSLRESLDISGLSPGLYIVHIEHSNGTIIRQLKVE